MDTKLNVQLQYHGDGIPLLAWFVDGKNAKLIKYSMLPNFPANIQSFSKSINNIIAEVKRYQFFKAKEQISYSPNCVRFTLLLRYISAQAYQVLIEYLLLPSMSLLRQFRQSKVDTQKALRLLHEKRFVK